MMDARRYKWLNAALFQVGWFCCILGSTFDALLATAFFMSVHLGLVKARTKEFIFVLQIALAGFSLDYMLFSMGYIKLSMDGSFPWFMLCLWVLFASTLNWSYNYLVSKPSIAIISGIVAPLSYFAAQRMGKVEYLKSTAECFIVHGLVWVSFLVFIHFIEFSKESLNHAR
jgi:hypothetical protein